MRISDWSSDVCSSDLKPEACERHIILPTRKIIFGLQQIEHRPRLACKLRLLQQRFRLNQPIGSDRFIQCREIDRRDLLYHRLLFLLRLRAGMCGDRQTGGGQAKNDVGAQHHELTCTRRKWSSKRTEERRVGQESVRTCRTRWSADTEKKNKNL